MKKGIVVVVIVIIVSAMGYMGLRSGDRFEHHGIRDHISTHEIKDISERSIPDTSKFIEVHSTLPELRSFFTELRTVEITSFPCENCHSTSLQNMKSVEGTAKAHWDVHIQHAGLEVMDCATCHNPVKMNELRTLTGKAISLDKSYELCGQCHNQQYKDWQGGAHGKNMSGWGNTRIVKSCVSCHNPHQPAIESRWPSRWVPKDLQTQKNTQ